MTVLDSPRQGIDVMRAFRALSGDLDAARDVLAANCLGAAEHEKLASRVARRARS